MTAILMQSPLNILLVDDDAVVQSLMHEYLNALGHTLEWFQSGNECIDKIQLLQPDIILLDLIMPDLSGLEVLQKLRPDRIQPHIPVVLLTANPGTSSLADKYPIKPDAYLTKPFDFASLQGILQLAAKK